MPELDPTVLKLLTDQANEIVAGSYSNADKLFSLTDTTCNDPDVASLAEAFGMMTVKVEAREFALQQTIEELKNRNHQIEELTRQRSFLSRLFVSIVLLITSYIFILGFIHDEFLSHLRMIQLITHFPVIEIICLVAIMYLIRISKFRLKDFGVTLSGWRRSVMEALWVSAVFIAVLALIKYVIVQRSPGVFHENQIFDFGYFAITYVTYQLVAPLQEFIGRGVVQGTLVNILDVRHKGLIAILVTTFLFSALHMTHSLNLSIASFITGLIPGWMYNRHQTIIGVSLAH